MCVNLILGTTLLMFYSMTSEYSNHETKFCDRKDSLGGDNDKNQSCLVPGKQNRTWGVNTWVVSPQKQQVLECLQTACEEDMHMCEEIRA